MSEFKVDLLSYWHDGELKELMSMEVGEEEGEEESDEE